MSKLLHFVAFGVMLALMLALAGCAAGQPTGPQLQGTAPADQPASVLEFLAADTPTATPPPTATPTPTSTPTPLPTPTPVAALSVGSLPAGQVLFSTQRTGEAGEQLWQVTAGDGLVELLSGVLPGGWRCAGGEPVTCAVVTMDQGLFALQPMTGTTALLDDLAPVALTGATAAISLTAGITETTAVSLTVGMTETAVASPTVALTSTAAISATGEASGAAVQGPAAPISPTAQLTATQPLQDGSQSPDYPVTQLSRLPVLAFAPSGDRLAVATEDRVTVYDLAAPAVLAVLDAGGPAELAWSPDGGRLALAYPAGEGNAIALWNRDDGSLRVLAQMEAAGRLAWAPDGSKLAFDARTSPGAPASQGGQSDIYVLYLRSGEIANLTEVFLRNNGVDPASQVAAWAPQWEPDGETVRYRRGLQNQIEQQNVVRHALRSRSPSVLWPAADEGALGLASEPGGQRLARVVLRDGRDVVQVRTADGDWQDASAGSFAAIRALVWSPAGAGEDDAARTLLIADRQTLLIIDPATGAISGLAVACPDCMVTNAIWLPAPQD
jgi:hypothetical protein